MQKRLIEKMDEWVSLLGFGCMRFPQQDGKIDMTQVQKMVDYAKSNGVNYFDTAYVYGDGDSERAIGQALREYPRDSFYIADKLPIWVVKEEADLQKVFNTSLERLGMEYIDFYLIHALDSNNWKNSKKYKAIEFCQKLREQGKIKHIGFSFHDTPEVFREIVDSFDWDFVQIQLNYLDWDSQRAKELYAIIEEKNLPCIVMEPIRGGSLANPPKEVADILKKANPQRSPSSWALNYCASCQQVKVILSGMSSMEQVVENVETLSGFAPFTQADYSAIDEAVEYINAQPRIGCTGCRYCMPCPSGVNIPGMFTAYNDYMRLGDRTRLDYVLNIENADSSEDKCISCGACVEKCPQHLDIPSELSKVTGIRNA